MEIVLKEYLDLNQPLDTSISNNNRSNNMSNNHDDYIQQKVCQHKQNIINLEFQSSKIKPHLWRNFI